MFLLQRLEIFMFKLLEVVDNLLKSVQNNFQESSSNIESLRCHFALAEHFALRDQG